MENSSCVCSDLCKCRIFHHQWYWCNSLRAPVALDWLDETHRRWPDSERCVSWVQPHLCKTENRLVFQCVFTFVWPSVTCCCRFMCIWNSACMSELLHWVSVCVCGCVVTGITLLEQAQLPIILFTQPLEPLTQSLSAGLAGLSFTPYKSMGCRPTFSWLCLSAQTQRSSVWEKTSAGDSQAMFPGTKPTL